MARYIPTSQTLPRPNPILLSPSNTTASPTKHRRENLGFLHRSSPLNTLYHSNPLRMAPMTPAGTRSWSAGVVRSSLIDPDGGDLVDLVVPSEERAERRIEAAALPAVRIGAVDLEWVHVLAEGWASPLRGFMREKEYLQSLHFNSIRMEDGSVVNMSLPIVLAIDDSAKEVIGSSLDVGLVGPDGEYVAVLRRMPKFWIMFGDHR